MAEILIRDPQLLYWVTDPQILRNVPGRNGKSSVRSCELQRCSRPSNSNSTISDLSSEERCCISASEICCGSASVEETWKALSVLAEALISAAHWICASALRREYEISGQALTGFTVIAMGKLRRW